MSLVMVSVNKNGCVLSVEPESHFEPNKDYMERSRNEHRDFYIRDYMEPDRRKTDYYCEICEAHMNSQDMWESHISGKRHLKNIQKLPGEMPSKVRAIKVNAKSKLVDAIKYVSEPIVGLDYMTELQRNDPHLNPTYMCYLCQANCTWSVVIDHILTTKHRLAYLKAVEPERYEMILNMELKSTRLDELAEDQAREHERKRGCGEIEVRLEKPKMEYSNTYNLSAPPPPRQDITYDVSSESSRSSSSERTVKNHRLSLRSPYRRHSYRSSSYKHRRYSRSSSEERSRYCASSPTSKMDIYKLSTSDKIKLMQKICKSIGPIPRNLVEELRTIIVNLTTELLRRTIRQLPLSAQNKLAKYIAKEETQKNRRQLMPYIEDIFNAISNIDLNIGHW